MKKIYLLFILAFTFLHSFAQIPNGSFESWTGGAPDGWVNTNSGSFIYLTQSSNAHAGTSACENSVVQIVAGVNIAVALITGDLTNEFIPCNARPAALHFWYIFNPMGGETFEAASLMKKNQGAFAATDNFTIGGVHDVYTEGIMNYNYIDVGNADSVNINFLINGFPSSSDYTLGTYFIVDDLSYGAATTGTENIQSQNSTFESVMNGSNPELIFSFAQSSKAVIQLYNLQGQLVSELANETFSPGRYKIKLSEHQLAAGMYVAKMNDGKTSSATKVFIAE